MPSLASDSIPHASRTSRMSARRKSTLSSQVSCDTRSGSWMSATAASDRRDVPFLHGRLEEVANGEMLRGATSPPAPELRYHASRSQNGRGTCARSAARCSRGDPDAEEGRCQDTSCRAPEGSVRSRWCHRGAPGGFRKGCRSSLPGPGWRSPQAPVADILPVPHTSTIVSSSVAPMAFFNACHSEEASVSPGLSEWMIFGSVVRHATTRTRSEISREK